MNVTSGSLLTLVIPLATLLAVLAWWAYVAARR